MFTGLVQSLGEVTQIEADGHGGRRLRVRELHIAGSLVIGESIAVNGVCLTAVVGDEQTFDFQLGPETITRSNLGLLRVGDRVNLERALRVGDAIGGHFVSGHVDAVGTLAKKETSGEWLTVWFSLAPEFDELLVEKGSIAVDGISLTLVDVVPGSFSVMLIPHTLSATTLGFKTVGDTVNLEFDLLAKHVRKLLAYRDQSGA